MEEYRNPNLTTSTIPPVVDEPVTTSNSSGAIVTETFSHPTVDTENTAETVGQEPSPEPSPEQSISSPQVPIQHPLREDTLAIVLNFEPITSSSEETSSAEQSGTHAVVDENDDANNMRDVQVLPSTRKWT